MSVYRNLTPSSDSHKELCLARREIWQHKPLMVGSRARPRPAAAIRGPDLLKPMSSGCGKVHKCDKELLRRWVNAITHPSAGMPMHTVFHTL